MNPTMYQIALTLISGVGDMTIKNLVSYCGSAEAVFKEHKKALLKIPGIGRQMANQILKADVFSRAESEFRFIEKHDVSTYFFTDKEYPHLLKQCADGPSMLYYRGAMSLNDGRFLGIVGTRNMTHYGRVFLEDFVQSLKSRHIHVVSGLAYGIDIKAHKECLKHNVPTMGVLAHGLDRVYPPAHRTTAIEMMSKGGLITEFPSGTNPDRENFPKRNRIIAGLCQAVLVVEAAKKGGALITAELANSYSRDVFALPGKIGETFSEGCNKLIKSNRAALLESVKDLEYIMGWTQEEKMKPMQKSLFVELSDDEQLMVDALNGGKRSLDYLTGMLNWPASKLFSTATILELKGVVKSFPGKHYDLA